MIRAVIQDKRSIIPISLSYFCLYHAFTFFMRLLLSCVHFYHVFNFIMRSLLSCVYFNHAFTLIMRLLLSCVYFYHPTFTFTTINFLVAFTKVLRSEGRNCQLQYQNAQNKILDRWLRSYSKGPDYRSFKYRIKRRCYYQSKHEARYPLHLLWIQIDV